MRTGMICYCTEQGLGHLAKSFWDAGIVTDACIYVHHSRENKWGWYPPDTLKVKGRRFHDSPPFVEWLKRLDVLLCFETPFDWQVLPLANDLNVKTVLVPMYEWYPKNPPHQFDRFICPSLLDHDCLKDQHPLSAVVRRIPVDPSTWKQRTRALKYLHNAGHIGYRGHKGTLELMRAMEHVRSPLSLTIRCQDEPGMTKLLEQVPAIRKDKRVSMEIGSIPHGCLFDGFDVYVAPEKFNGLSLPLQEARAAGMVVMASDRYPANTWLPKGPLIPVRETRRACVHPNYLDFDESIIDPKDVAGKMDQFHGGDIVSTSLSGKRWAEDNSWAALKGKWLEALSC